MVGGTLKQKIKIKNTKFLSLIVISFLASEDN